MDATQETVPNYLHNLAFSFCCALAACAPPCCFCMLQFRSSPGSRPQPIPARQWRAPFAFPVQPGSAVYQINVATCVSHISVPFCFRRRPARRPSDHCGCCNGVLWCRCLSANTVFTLSALVCQDLEPAHQLASNTCSNCWFNMLSIGSRSACEVLQHTT